MGITSFDAMTLPDARRRGADGTRGKLHRELRRVRSTRRRSVAGWSLLIESGTVL